MKILIVSNNESITELFSIYLEMLEIKPFEIVNEKPAIACSNPYDAAQKILSSDFDVLVIGHRLNSLVNEPNSLSWKNHQKGTAIETLECISSFLNGKTVISDGYTTWNDNNIMSLYKKLGVKHFINRTPVNFKERFSNLLKCLSGTCDCSLF